MTLGAVSRRLYRRPMYERLERLSLKWDKLPFCNYCIQVEDEINPDRLEDLEHNASKLEMIRGYVRRDLTLADGKIDCNLTHYFDSIRHRWNKDPKNMVLQLYVVRHHAIEHIPGDRRRPRDNKEVLYHFLQTLRGKRSVGDVDSKLEDGANGIAQTRSRIQDCINTRLVDKSIEEILEQNRIIQRGGE